MILYRLDGEDQTSSLYSLIDTGRHRGRTEVFWLQKEWLPRDTCNTRYHRERKDQSECVLAVHVEPEKAFLADEAKAGIQPEGSSVVYFSFKDDLYSGGGRQSSSGEPIGTGGSR